uniref:Uncharacterized protein n=1 Tax=Chromera velia CCMP2878 TaxID=1169474 RepID=A0A0G4GJE5_9ALVE|eukprot:Cvel_22154.t1-p1 / transcript=Cvel_22154.t1 / gene=Cvel_22154 / organism=Chromera_velia_CCMP2878 / gene_product=hypothetical protein / transcript_product=hypothetical protein / location=Cvel_scaffold2150:143-1223(-) / protein_length=147 / sequence_SO=supercontig / SO=protein_coding / is_pseudo=false
MRQLAILVGFLLQERGAQGLGVNAVAAGYSHSILLDENGDVWTTGSGADGALGLGNWADVSSWEKPVCSQCWDKHQQPSDFQLCQACPQLGINALVAVVAFLGLQAVVLIYTGINVVVADDALHVVTVGPERRECGYEENALAREDR